MLFTKRYRINRISASGNEPKIIFFLLSNRTKRIVMIVKTFRHCAFYIFFFPELLHSSKQNLLKCGKRTKIIPYISWKHSRKFIFLKGFFITIGSSFIETSIFSIFLYLNFNVEHHLGNGAYYSQISKWAIEGTAEGVDN